MTSVGSGTVYVVDDDAAVRDSLLFLLEVEGLTAQGFDSVERFLATVPERAAGCVVSDMRMPGMDGEDLLRLLPLHRPGLPVIVITGHGDVGAAVHAMAAGAFDFIEKPFQDVAILEAVRAALPGADQTARMRRAEAMCARIAGLSEIDRTMLMRLLHGESSRALASALHIALGAQSLADLVRSVGQACGYAGASACSL
jgi:two-component system response regulator FixJ